VGGFHARIIWAPICIHSRYMYNINSIDLFSNCIKYTYCYIGTPFIHRHLTYAYIQYMILSIYQLSICHIISIISTHIIIYLLPIYTLISIKQSIICISSWTTPRSLHPPIYYYCNSCNTVFGYSFQKKNHIINCKTFWYITDVCRKCIGVFVLSFSINAIWTLLKILYTFECLLDNNRQ